MDYKAKFADQGASPSDSLIAGNAHLLVARTVTVTGGKYPRGALLGKITASGKHTLSASAASDGSEDVDLVLAEDVDASAGDKQALAYSRGDFAASAITLGAGHTLATVQEALRAKGITLLPVMS